MPISQSSHLRNLVCCLVLICTACSSVPVQKNQAGTQDPYEPINRKSYRLTDEIDRRFIEPVADAYIKHVPKAIQRPVSNFYRNLSYPSVVLNSFLQGKVRQGFSDMARFVINTTIGVGGLSDMAGHMGFPEHNEDFGQTLAIWGVSNGPYLFIPLYGPSTGRDVTDLPFSYLSDGLFYLAYALGGPVIIPLAVLRVIDKRASLADAMKIRDESALDPYLFVRESYMQHREYLIYDGNPPVDNYDNQPDDEADQPVNEPASQSTGLEEKTVSP